MAYFFCKFITPRKDFLKTMSADEAKLLKAHGEYLQGLLEHGNPPIGQAVRRRRPRRAAFDFGNEKSFVEIAYGRVG